MKRTSYILVYETGKINLVEACLRKAELLLWDECCPRRALQMLQKMLDICDDSMAHLHCLAVTSTVLQLRILLLKATIFTETKCYLEAFKVLQKALALVMDHPNELWRAKVQLQLAYVWMGLKELQQARNTLDVCFPVLCGSEYPMEQARAWFLEGLLNEGSSTDKEGTNSAVECYEQALQFFSVCTSVTMMMSCLYRIAILHDKTGDIRKRDQFSTIFTNLCEKYPHVDKTRSL